MRLVALTSVVALGVVAGTGCIPAVRAGAYYREPLYEPARTTSPLRAAYRVLPPPRSCAAVAPPIVFLPALGFTGQSWSRMTSLLHACRARVLVDLPGIGESAEAKALARDEVVAAIATVIHAESGGRPVVLVGNSVGGILSGWLALRAPGTVAALVLVDGPLVPFPLSSSERTALHPVALGPLIRLAGPFFAERLALPRTALAGHAPDPLTVALTVEQTTDSRRRVAMQHYHDSIIDNRSLAAEQAALPRLHQPTLILWGDHDRITSPALAEPIARTIGGPAKVVILHDVGHLAALEAPAEVARVLDEFLAALPFEPAAARDPALRRRIPGLFAPGTLIYGARREWFPVLGAAALFSGDSRTDLDVVAGVARGSIDRHYPLETGRIVWTAGVGFDATAGDPRGWQLGYLRSTLRVELVWRWAGGINLDGTLFVDPSPDRPDRIGGMGALGYTPSVLPWVRGFVGYGSFPQTSARLIFGIEIDARLTGWLF